MNAKHLLYILILGLLLTSCKTSKNISYHNLSSLDPNFSASYENRAIKEGSFKSQTSLLQLLKIEATDTISEVKLAIQNNGELQIDYDNHKGKQKSIVLKGKFKKHYYQIFFERNQIILPPFYWVTHIERIRLSISKDNLLVINNYSEHTGMIMMFAGGSSSKTQHLFKKSRN